MRFTHLNPGGFQKPPGFAQYETKLIEGSMTKAANCFHSNFTRIPGDDNQSDIIQSRGGSCESLKVFQDRVAQGLG